MRSLLRRRSRMGIVFSLVALASLIGGFAFFVGLSPLASTAQAKGLTYSDLSQMQKRLLSGFVSSELGVAQNAAQTRAATRGNFTPTGDDGCPQNKGDNIRTALLSPIPTCKGVDRLRMKPRLRSIPCTPTIYSPAITIIAVVMATAARATVSMVGRVGPIPLSRWDLHAGRILAE